MKTLLEKIEGKGRFAKIAKMTAVNDHNGSIRAAAEMLGFKKIANCIKLVEKLQTIEGEMPEPLLAYQRSLRNELLKHAKDKLTPEEYDQLHGSF